MIKLLVLIGLFILMYFSREMYGQSNYPVSGTVYVRDGNATKVNLLVQSSNSRLKIPVDRDGNFIISLNWGIQYVFCFSKSGYVSKKIIFSTKIPDNIDISTIYPYNLLVELFPLFPGVDTMFYKKPVAKIQFSESINDFDFDTDYQLSIRNKLEKTKEKYSEWLNRGMGQKSNSKAEIKENQKEAILRYQKTVETNQTNKLLPVKTTTIINVSPPLQKDPFNLPPIKEKYPEGKTIEIFQLEGKQIIRVIIKNGKYQKAFYEVKHNWGGVYYFVQDSPSNYRSISKYNFDKFTGN